MILQAGTRLGPYEIASLLGVDDDAEFVSKEFGALVRVRDAATGRR